MNPEAEKLYNLLPALYRIRDAEQGGPLKALCAVIAEADRRAAGESRSALRRSVHRNLRRVGGALHRRPDRLPADLHGVTARTRSARAEVANTIAYRRRKGTATVLEQLARDVTGWNARVVEFFQWLETSQYMNHIRPANRVTADLRNWEALERRDTAFNTIAHSVDMRRIETQKGRYNIPNVGLFLWRLDAFSLTRSPAFRIDDRALHCSARSATTSNYSPGRRAKPISPISPSRSTCRSRSAGACCTADLEPLLRDAAELVCRGRRHRYEHRRDSRFAISPTTARAGRICR